MPALPSCPRCGYDLSGHVATWSDSCPLTGQCSECGLEFDWRPIVDHAFWGPPDAFESAGHRLVRAFFTTLCRAARPRRLWTWLRLEHRGRPARMVLFVVLGMAAVHLAAAAAVTLLVLLRCWLLGQPTEGILDVTVDTLLATRTMLWLDPTSPEGHGTVPTLSFLFLMLAATPLAYQALPRTLATSKIRKINLLRVWAYSLVWTPALIDLASFIRMLPDQISLVTMPFLPTGGMRGGFETPADLPQRLAVAAYEWTQTGRPIVLHEWTRVCFVLVIAWTLIWWSRANALYLRIDHPRLVALLMLVTAFLAAWVVFAAFPSAAGLLIWKLFTGQAPHFALLQCYAN